MKTLKILFTLIMLTAITTGLSAQAASKSSQPASKTESFKVWGKCDMCKDRIEKSLKMDGITKAEWNEKTQLATVTYNPAKITVDAMQKKVASVGHDTEKYKAPNDVYEKLPDCCHYDRAK